MTEPIDADRDPLIARASTALRSRTHAAAPARAALLHALDATGGQVGRSRRARMSRPALAFAIAAGIVLVAGLRLAVSERGGVRGTADAVGPASTTLVEFSFDAPAARIVSVVGEFNGWNGRAAPMRRATNGRWVADLALAPGRHTYGFEVDGDGLVPDPKAPAAPEQMFGVRHSVVVVASRGVEY